MVTVISSSSRKVGREETILMKIPTIIHSAAHSSVGVPDGCRADNVSPDSAAWEAGS